jgi:uncharacterized membrane protein HdeD (DUF308 family)
MILTGVVQCVSYWWGRDNRHDNNGWIFADALMTFVLGILVLTSLIAADAAIPMVFGLWVMFSGILRIVVATMIDVKTKKKNFFWTLATGAIGTGSGLYAFLNPYVANLNIAVLLGFLFIIQGICTMELGIHMPHEKKEKVAKPKAKMIKIQIKKPVKKKVDKSKTLFASMPAVDLTNNEIQQDDIKKFMTSEIKLDDIRAALEFNFGGDDADKAEDNDAPETFEIPEESANEEPEAETFDEEIKTAEEPAEETVDTVGDDEEK